jgi:hypothetical protein
MTDFDDDDAKVGRQVEDAFADMPRLSPAMRRWLAGEMDRARRGASMAGHTAPPCRGTANDKLESEPGNDGLKTAGPTTWPAPSNGPGALVGGGLGDGVGGAREHGVQSVRFGGDASPGQTGAVDDLG